MMTDTEYPDEIHVIPADDLREHAFAGDCWCRPDCRHESSRDGILFHWLHRPADGRDRYAGGEVVYQ